MPDYWGKTPVKAPTIDPDRYTAKPSEYVYNGQRITLKQVNEYFSVSGYQYTNGTSMLQVPEGLIFCVTAIHWNLTDITAPAPVTTDLTLGWSDGDVLIAYRTEDGNPQVVRLTFTAPYPEVPAGSDIRMFHVSAVGAPTYRGHLNLYGFFIQSSVSLR